MAMIKCAECGKEFSDRANACPNCGCPIEYQAEKSIGGEYHAADKLAPSVIVEHLTIAKELESERYTLLCAVDKLQAKINRLGIKRKIEKSEFNMKHYVGLAFVILNIASAVLTLSIRTVSLPCSSSRTNRRPSPERIANSSCVSPASFLLVFINCAILFTENHLRCYNLNIFYTL